MKAYPVMPKVVAIWLIENTALTFKQIADFCGMHLLAIEALAKQENPLKHGLSPVTTGELTEEEIRRCEKDSTAELQYTPALANIVTSQKKSISKFNKQNKPKAILWLVQNYTKLSNYQISKLVSSTPPIVKAIRSKTYWNYNNLSPQNPVSCGLCTESDLVAALVKADKKSAETTAPASCTESNPEDNSAA